MPLMPVWRRIEPHASTTDINVGLAAEVADPLWMILRQWQLGELRGDDCGSPAAIDIATSYSRFTHYRADVAPNPVHPEVLGTPQPVDDSAGPIEALVEREPQIRLGGRTPWSVSVRAGRRLRRMLAAKQLDPVADRFAEHAPFEADRADKAVAPADERVEGVDDERYRVLLADPRNVIDGVAVLKMHRAGPIPAEIIGAADAAGVEAVVRGWADEMEREWRVTDGAGLSGAWDRERQEYAFSIGAPPLPGEDDEIVLRAAEYDGTGVRWDALDLDRDPVAALGAVAAGDDTTGTRICPMLPVPLTFAGMPADRFWEFEDSAVALGQVRSGPTDLARVVAIDFAVVYSPDWFVAPVEVPVGSVARVDWVVVRDTFGVATLVGDKQTQAPDRVGRLFQPDDVTGGDADNPYLVVLPSVLAGVTSEPQEEVALQRDEMANLAWSIERVVLGPSGRPVPRQWFAADFALPPATSAEDFELIWRLATRVAHPWTPLVAVRGEDGFLFKARILDTESTQVRGAQSLLMADVTKVRDEEITRAGVQLRLVEQCARTPDGRRHVWRGREKRAWRGEASSGLRFDDATAP